MKKTDKFLYGGFAVALVGFVAMMLVSVFSPLKQPAEETAQTPKQPEQAMLKTIMPDGSPMPPIPDGYAGYWVDDDGTIVYVTQEDLDAGEAHEEELKRQEAEQIAREKAEKEWWASRQDWIDRFPFEPTHHPEIAFDPHDPSEKMRVMVNNHSFLRSFYESKLRYTKEFEQLYDIVQEEVGEEKADNPIILGKVFTTLRGYHHAKSQVPEAIYRKNARVYRPQLPPKPPDMLAGLTPEQLAAYRALPGEVRREMTRELRASQSEEYVGQLRAYNRTPQYQTVDITWGEEAESRKRIIIGTLFDHLHPGQPWMSQQQARAIRERLLNEIPAEGFSKMPEVPFAYVDRYERELKPGDPLLIK